jgi:hypothetical protein
MKKSNHDPIFIVGSPRSGTTLLSAMLGSHSRLYCGPETQFFNKIANRKLEDIINDDDWDRKASKILCEITLSKQLVVELFGENENSIAKYLNDKPKNKKSLLESLCRNNADKNGKARWIEKTPNHILHLAEIRSMYPESKIIRIMRDPRDSAKSMIYLPWTTESFIENSYLWKKWYDESEEFLNTDNQSLTVKFEDLLCESKNVLTKICNFIGEDFEEGMTDTMASAKLVISKGEPWKNQVGQSLDTKRVATWKTKLNQEEISFSDRFFKKVLNIYEYEFTTHKIQELVFYPYYGPDTILKNEGLIKSITIDKDNVLSVGSNYFCQKLLILNTVNPSSSSHAKLILLLCLRKLLFQKTYLSTVGSSKLLSILSNKLP